MELLAIGALGLLGKMLSSRGVRERLVYEPFDGKLPDEKKIVQKRWDDAKTPSQTGVFANKLIIEKQPFVSSRSLGDPEKDAELRNTKLELFTGVEGSSSASWLKPKKQELANPMRPEDNMVMVTSGGSGGNPYSNFDRNRYIPSNKAQGVPSIMNPIRDKNALLENPLFRADTVMPHAKPAEMVMPPIPGVAPIPAGVNADGFCLTQVRSDDHGTAGRQGLNPAGVGYFPQPGETLVGSSVRNTKLPHTEYAGPGIATYPMNDSARASKHTRDEDRTGGFGRAAAMPAGVVGNMTLPGDCAFTRDHRTELNPLPLGVPRGIPAQDIPVAESTGQGNRMQATGQVLNARGVNMPSNAYEALHTNSRRNGEKSIDVSVTNAFAYNLPPSAPADESRGKKDAEKLNAPILQAASRVLNPATERASLQVELAPEPSQTGYVGGAQALVPSPPVDPAAIYVSNKILTALAVQPEKGIAERLPDATQVEHKKRNALDSPSTTYANLNLPQKDLGELTKDPRKVCPENPHPPIAHLSMP